MTPRGTPVFILCRDRVEALRELVDWLEGTGFERIHLPDNDSAYEPLLEYYRRTPHDVVRLGRNVGKNALWVDRRFKRLVDRRKVCVHRSRRRTRRRVPERCHRQVLGEPSTDHPDVTKVGFGSVWTISRAGIDSRREVIEWGVPVLGRS